MFKRACSHFPGDRADVVLPPPAGGPTCKVFLRLGQQIGGDRLQQVFAVRDVLLQRHRGHIKAGIEPTHRESVNAVGVDLVQRGGDDGRSGERHEWLYPAAVAAVTRATKTDARAPRHRPGARSVRRRNLTRSSCRQLQQGGVYGDFKIECGFDRETGELLVADVIDSDSGRLRFGEVDMSKQSYRDGTATLPEIKKKFDEVATLTEHFV